MINTIQFSKMNWVLTIAVGFLVVIQTAVVRSESSTCFLEVSQTYGHCEYGCCGTQLDSNQRCCDSPDLSGWIAAVAILGSLLGASWIICVMCLVHKAIKNSKKSRQKVAPTKKSKKTKKEKKTQFVNPTMSEPYYTNPPPQYQLEPPQQSNLKSNLKNGTNQPEPGQLQQRKMDKKEKKLYPIRRNTEFTQVAFQPPSRSSGIPEWMSSNQQSEYRGRPDDVNDGRQPFPFVQSPDSYY